MALTVTVLGALLLSSGVALRFGPGWALITGGLLAVVGGLLLIDVDEDRRRRR